MNDESAQTPSRYRQLFNSYLSYLESGQASAESAEVNMLLTSDIYNQTSAKRILLDMTTQRGNTILMEAARLNKLGSLPTGAFTISSLNATNTLGQTVFHIAAANGGLRALEHYFSTEHLSKPDIKKLSPLHYLSERNPNELRLLNIAAEIAAKSISPTEAAWNGLIAPEHPILAQFKSSPLHLAARTGRLHLFDQDVLTFEALKDEDFSGETVGDIAARAGYYSQIPKAVAEKLMLVQNSSGNTPLYYACQQLHLRNFPTTVSDSTIKKALMLVNKKGASPIIAAAKSEFSKVPARFITSETMCLAQPKHAEPVYANKSTMEIVAINISSISAEQIISGLLELRDSNNTPFIHYLARHGKLPIIEFRPSTNWNQIGCNYCTEVELTQVKQATKKALALTDDQGNTALHVAVAAHYLRRVPAFCFSPATLHAKNHAGQQPLCQEQVAEQIESFPKRYLTKEILLMQDETGRTPLHIAAQALFNGLPANILNVEMMGILDKSGQTPIGIAMSKFGNDIGNRISKDLCTVKLDTNNQLTITPQMLISFGLSAELSDGAENSLPSALQEIRKELRSAKSTKSQVFSTIEDSVDLDI